MRDFLCSVVLRGLDIVRKKGRTSTLDLPIDSVSLSLQDLIGYFQPPGDHLEHEDKQNRLRALKNRQNLFQEEVRFPCQRFSLIYLHIWPKQTFDEAVNGIFDPISSLFINPGNVLVELSIMNELPSIFLLFPYFSDCIVL